MVIAATLAYSWWMAGLRPFSWPALLAVGTAGMAAIVVGTRRRRPSRSSGHHPPHGALAWAFLCAVLAGWEIAAYLQHPRVDHPTLSSLADQVLDWRPARALAFLVWLAVGAGLARR